jgi:hypothetical protein
MARAINRRHFVTQGLAAGAVAGLTDFGFLNRLPAVSAQEAQPHPSTVRYGPDIEPLVRLIEDTDRAKLVGTVAARLREGLSYQQLLTALLLAGVRSIQPRPVGFKFHAVLVVNSAHLASLAASDQERWLPLFWALDNFKASQARNKVEGDWSMPAVDEAKLPPGHLARQRFIEAMDNWDEEGTDRAVTALVRNAGAGEIVELFWRYGARDFRDIGHKAIYVANSWRTLQTIGWRHAEPVMRSLAYALLEHENGNPASRDAEPDRPWRENVKRAGQIRADWQEGKISPRASVDVLAAMRTASPTEACGKVIEVLNAGVGPESVWDALFLTAGELLMRQPGIVGIHCVTSANALHYGYQASGNDETRRLLLLQAAAFLTMFRKFMAGRGKLKDGLRVDTLEKIDPNSSASQAIEEIFADVSKDRMVAAQKTLALLDRPNADPHALMAAGRRLVFQKGNDSHDYKFSSAALEDYYHVTPAWRNRYLAMSMFNLRGANDRDNKLIKQTRGALEA